MNSGPGENGHNVNGKLRHTSREKLFELHRKLHNDKMNENVIENEPIQLVDEKPPRIRRSDVRKYLGDPLPLPYLDYSTRDETSPKVGESNDRSNHVTNRIKFQTRRPLGQNHVENEGGDIYKEKLKESLKKFQRSTASSTSRKLVDRVVQTEDSSNEPITPQGNPYNYTKVNDYKSPTLSLEGSPSGLNYRIMLETFNDKDFIINNFKSRNPKINQPFVSTPNSKSPPRTTLLEPFQPPINKPKLKRADNKNEYIHIRLLSILGSPLFLLGLIFLLYYNLQNHLQREFKDSS